MTTTRRGGLTLVEMMVVITLMTLVAGVALSLLRSLMLADRRARDAAPRRVAVAQLRDAVRSDIRRAARVRADGGALVVERHDGAVTYDLADGLCRRRVGDAPEVGTYAVGGAERWLVEGAGAERGVVVSVRLVQSDDAPGVPIHVAAELGAAAPVEGEAP